jgi:aryl-alcohol dehydrogenase-like predicted oxidoreductase
MERRPLFHANLNVSVVGLGTMTWGEQNTEAEAHAQLDWAMQHGVNFVDTAEMYPVPPKAETGLRTEIILGKWLAIPGNRQRIVLGTKIAGPGRRDWIRNGATSLTKANIIEACEGSLKRLQTDHIDLYQIHWPDRNVAAFGAWQFDSGKERETVPIVEQVEALHTLIKDGKIGGYGLSNESAWGTTMFCRAAEAIGAPKPAAIQNPYCLLNRVFEGDLAEVSYREQVPLLAYSPLAMGTLTGKYLNGAMPKGSRFQAYADFGVRYRRPLAMIAAEEYAALAKKYGVSLLEFSLSFVINKWFVGSAIIGATSVRQLQQIYNAHQVQIDPAAFKEVEAISARYLHPAA